MKVGKILLGISAFFAIGTSYAATQGEESVAYLLGWGLTTVFIPLFAGLYLIRKEQKKNGQNNKNV